MNGECESGGDWWGQTWSWRLAHTWDKCGWVVQLKWLQMKYWATQKVTILFASTTLSVLWWTPVFRLLSPPGLSSKWLTGWLNNWLSHSLTDACQKNHWLRDLLSKWLNDLPTGWLSEWQNVWLSDSLTGWLIICFFFSFSLICLPWIGRLIDTCLLDRPFNRTTGWLRKRKGPKRGGKWEGTDDLIVNTLLSLSKMEQSAAATHVLPVLYFSRLLHENLKDF